MKAILLIQMICFSSVVIAQNNSISKNVDDNGKTISIKVNGIIDGKKIDYENTFDSKHLNKSEREALIKRVFDSLGVDYTNSLPFFLKPAIKTPDSFELKNGAPQIIVQSNNAKSYAVGGPHPYTKEIKYDPKSGMLFMRYRFTKNGEERIYEKNVDANVTSEQQCNDIIKKYEKEIGLPTTEK